MITSQIEHEGKDFTIHHNGDFSGNAHIVLDHKGTESLGAHGCQVKIPIAVLRELIGRDLQSIEIGRIEQMSGAEFLYGDTRKET